MKVKVPGSSANLGPGFDCFGVAWQCYNELEFLPGDELVIRGCDAAYQNADNLAYAGYRAALEAAGQRECGVTIRFGATEIPVSRGLGSSAALIVAGVAAANALHGLGMDRQALLSVATAVEGHPDNIAPSLFGGLTASMMEGERAITVPFSLHPSFHFTALIPDFELSTKLARSVLPAQVPRSDAIFNVSRAALLLRALEDGDAELLPLALTDRLHQPYRTGLIAHYDEARALAEDCGALCICISGAGPTLLCVSLDEGFAGRMREALGAALPAWRVLSLAVDRQGVQCSD